MVRRSRHRNAPVKAGARYAKIVQAAFDNLLTGRIENIEPLLGNANFSFEHYDVTNFLYVPGELDASWSDWVGGMTITCEGEGESPPLTTLTGTVDQAALQGLLRRLYALGLPLISVVCVDCGSE